MGTLPLAHSGTRKSSWRGDTERWPLDVLPVVQYETSVVATEHPKREHALQA